jgi:hypothetical protein
MGVLKESQIRLCSCRREQPAARMQNCAFENSCACLLNRRRVWCSAMVYAVR